MADIPNSVLEALPLHRDNPLDLSGIGWVVHLSWNVKLDLNGRTRCSMEVETSLQTAWSPRDISRFPANRRDIAVLVAENVAAADVLAECKLASGGV
ncbi:hypothetical protein MJ585_16825 [Klebsiella pneumoniae]|nr:hypothetical protein MJ585_16825 [Klebsiella pneumoniae]